VTAAASFLALPPSDRLLLLRACLTLVFARTALRLLPLAWLRAWAGRRGDGGTPVDRVAWAVSAVSRRLTGTTCLASAFALQRLLAREGHASDLHIGVAKRQTLLAAHAWIVCEGRVLIGEHESGDYTHLLAWRVVDAPPDDGSSETG
jgi:Transglutaminase-like superfamily